jgi:hypothetical protein
MKITQSIFLLALLLIGCSKHTPASTPQPAVDRPTFGIYPTDVVSVVVKPSNQPDHVAELEMQLTEDCVRRYEPFGKTNHGQIVELLANGKPLLEQMYAPDHWDTNFTAFIYTSMEDATNLADSLKSRQPKTVPEPTPTAP